MFTGLIETTGTVRSLYAADTVLRVAIDTELAGELAPGDSLAVNGVCLTVTSSDGGALFADVGPETARITTLGGMRTGQVVNLERSMRADGRFGGHFVQGHVDAVGSLAKTRAEGDAHWLTVTFPAALAPFFVRKGSVAVDGISLTVAELRDGEFDVMIVPFTWEHTNLRSLRDSDRVNLECDMIGKYVARALEVRD
jgi:riboflavin synthase